MKIIYFGNTLNFEVLKSICLKISNELLIAIQLQRIWEISELLNIPHPNIIYIIDISDDPLNIIKRLKIIFNNNINSNFLLLSDNREYQSISYCIKPFGFFIKPLNCQLLAKTLREIVVFLFQNKKYIITNEHPHLKIYLSSIFYLEASNRLVTIHTISGDYLTKTPIKAWYNYLQNQYFIKIFRGILVNLCYVKNFDHQYVYLINDEKLPISRFYYATFVNKFSTQK